VQENYTQISDTKFIENTHLRLLLQFNTLTVCKIVTPNLKEKKAQTDG